MPTEIAEPARTPDLGHVIETAIPRTAVNIPEEALVLYTLSAEEFAEFLQFGMSVDWIIQSETVLGYILPSRLPTLIDKHIEYTNVMGNWTNNWSSVRIHPYNIDLEYYNTLTDKQQLSQIIGDDIAEEDIDFAIIFDYKRTAPQMEPGAAGWYSSYAYFGVQTTKGDYFLEDKYMTRDGSTIHNWIVYTPEEFSRRLARG